MNLEQQEPQEPAENQVLQDQWDEFGYLNEGEVPEQVVQEQIPPVVNFGQMDQNYDNPVDEIVNNQEQGYVQPMHGGQVPQNEQHGWQYEQQGQQNNQQIH